MDDKGHRGRKGPAPVASLEDLSDESPPGEDKSRLTLPAIREDPRRMMGPTPRIDISRASSSSHQEDSSPERDLLAGGTEGGAKLGLGFTEEMAQELRSSTEELDFQDPEDTETKSRRKKLQSQQAVNKYELETQSEKDFKEGRKDSACSEGGFLFIGGRTSRLSSIGSAASGGSATSGVSGISAVSGASHLSATSHLSAASNYSKASRCSSPHRMMLETSFCGPKPIPTPSLEAENPPTEAALLARDQADPTGAVLPPDAKPIPGAVPPPQAKLYSGKSKLEPSSESTRPRHKSKSPKKLSRSKKKQDDNELVKIIPLHGSLEEPESDGEPEIVDVKTNAPPSPPEGGIYIPLKGPDPGRPDRVQTERPSLTKNTPKPPPVEENDLVRFISLHGEDDEDLQKTRREPTQNRNGHNVQFKPWTEDAVYMVSRERDRRKTRTPEPGGKSAPPKLEFASKHGQQIQNYAQSPRSDSRTPSPATSFTRGSIFRRSSDSNASSKKSQGDSKSKKDPRNKSVFGSLFKKPQKEREKQPNMNKVSEPTANASSNDSKHNMDFKLKNEERRLPEGDSIIIPLHSPDSIVEPLIVVEPEPLEVHKSREPVGSMTDMSQVPSEVTVEEQPMATNVIVVDVINEDKVVTLEELRNMKRIPSRDSCSSRHSNITIPSQITPVNSVNDFSQNVRNSSEIVQKESARKDGEPNRERDAANQSKSEIRKPLDISIVKREVEIIEMERSPTEITKRERIPAEEVRKSISIEEIKMIRKIDTPLQSVSSRVTSDDADKRVIHTNKICREMIKLRETRIDTTDSDDASELVFKDISVKEYKYENKDKPSSPSPCKEEETPLINSFVEESSVKDDEEEYLLARSNTTESEATVIENHLVQSSQEEQRSSGSEHEIDIVQKATSTEDDNERKSLFQQNDSVEEELPYVPTTLPLERSIGVPILPIKQRVSEIRTCPIERPRSTTPINPTCLEDYTIYDDSSTSSSSSGKMQIILPRADSIKGTKLKTGGRVKPWNVFTEECLQSPKETRRTESPPPLPPRGTPCGSSPAPSTTPQLAAPSQPTPSWVSFDEMPERKRAPKRITTLPHRPQQSHVVYSYVNPEDCSCECHDPKHSND